MKKFLLISVLVIFTAAISIVVTMYIVDTSDTPSSYQVHEIDSKILSEKREIIVKLPFGYEQNSDRLYPVIYVFGGNTLTYSIAYDTGLLSRTSNLQDVIVVGISNINQKTRQRDLTPPFMKQDIDEEDSPLGKADKYLEFVEKEVIALIENEYGISSKRIAVGHSREGLMVMYSLIAVPELFQGHLALSPALWREDNIFVEHFKNYLIQTDTVQSVLFMSMGENEVERMKNAFNLTVEFLNENSVNKKIKWESMYTKGAIHSNNALLSAPIGLDKVLNKK